MIIGKCPVCGEDMRVGSDMTNADRIRNMADEELAEYLFARGNEEEYCYGICAYQDECDIIQSRKFCIEQIVKWLKEDWIRTMPIEQLAKRIGCMVEMDSCDPYETCDECRLAWLKREVKL